MTRRVRHQNMHYVYVLQSQLDSTTYVGCSSDLRRRIQEHNSGRSPYTKSRKPWKLIYYEAYEILPTARKREYELKNNNSEKEKLYKRIFTASSSSG